MSLIVNIIYRAIQLYTLIVIINVILSYFVPPYQPVRRVLNSLVEPALAPIRRLMPQTGMVDFSPLVLVLALQLLGILLLNLFR